MRHWPRCHTAMALCNTEAYLKRTAQREQENNVIARAISACMFMLVDLFAHINGLFRSYKLLFLSIKKLAFINRWRLEFSSDECSCRHAPYCIFVIHEQSTDRGVDIDKVRINGCRNDCDDCRWYDIIAGGFLGIGRFWTAISTSQDD